MLLQEGGLAATILRGEGGARLAAHARRATRLHTCAKLMDRLLDESMQSGSQIALPRLEASSLGSLEGSSLGRASRLSNHDS